MTENLCLGCFNEQSADVRCPRCGWVAGAGPDSPLYLAPGTVLENQFLIGRVLGHGGFGVLYLAWDLRLHRKVAVKEYMPQGIAGRAPGTTQISIYHHREDYEWGLARFLDEARVVARFHDRPDIITVITYFPANGTGYMVMEYLEGKTLLEYVKSQGDRIPYATALRIMTPVMDALRQVHNTGILHRDISPDNIFITSSGLVKVLDFGAARQALGQKSQNLSVILKEGYAPEEQYRTKGHQGPWTDVYATAATFYRIITGQVPPPATDRAYRDEIQLPAVLGADIPPAAESQLMRALAVRAEDRFQTMAEFQEALPRGELAPAPQPPRRDTSWLPEPAPVPPPRPVWETVPKWGWGAAAAAVLAVILVAVYPRKPSDGPGPVIEKAVIDPQIVGVWRWRWTDPRGAHLCHIRYESDGTYQWLEDCPPAVQGDRGQVTMADGKYEARSAISTASDRGAYVLAGDRLRVQSASGIVTDWERFYGSVPRPQTTPSPKPTPTPQQAIDSRIVGTWRWLWNDARGAHFCYIRYDSGGTYQWLEVCPPVVQGDRGRVVMLDGRWEASSAVTGAANRGSYTISGNRLRVQDAAGIVTEWERFDGSSPRPQPTPQPRPPVPTPRPSPPAEEQVATLMRQRQYDRALPLIESLLQQNPVHGYANAMKGYIALYHWNDPMRARPHYQTAYDNGAAVLFQFHHDLRDGTFQQRQMVILAVARTTVRMVTSDNRQVFQVDRSAVREAKFTSRLTGTVLRRGGFPGAFHITLTDGRNFNLAPTTAAAKAEAELAISLLSRR
jgi:serine/threonine protein kinase